MSIKHLYPTSTPALNLNSKSSRVVDPRISTTRASTATYVDPVSGLVKTAPANVARVEKGGLLVEESRTNLVADQNLTASYWTKNKLTAAASSITSPDGATNAYLLTENTDASIHWIKTTNNVVKIFTTYSYSLFAKSNGRSIRLSISGLGTQSVYFDLINGVVHQDSNGTTGKIEPFPNGWYKCSLIITTPNSNNRNINMYLWGANGSTELNYQGDGTSGVYVSFVQLEIGDFPTSYIPTSGSTVTRTADACAITGTNFSSWYSQSEGTIVSNSVTAAVSAFAYTINDGSNNNRLGFNSGTGFGQPFANVSGPAYNFGTAPTLVAGGGLVAFGYKASDYAAYGDATALTGPTVTSVPTGLDELAIGFRGTYQQDAHLTGHISRIAYYNTRVSDTALQSLTL